MAKGMTLKEFDRFRKLMALTTSDHDPEALAALRQANKVLSTNKITWDDVFKKLVSVEGEEAPDEPSAARSGDGIEEAFVVVRKSLRPGSFADFIDSLEEQWHEKGYLTPNQREALFKAAKNASTPRYR